ncbi:MAG: sigma-70 family RNA polymerase sigma factor [Acidimicrobiales bacterium]
MPRTPDELAQAAADAEAWLDSLDPDATPADDPADLRRIGLALGDVAAAERELADAVHNARDNGRNWSEIGLVLGVSKQAARQRFGAPAHA